jgi:uncharacterized cupredoxin-like copper-binding protein
MNQVLKVLAIAGCLAAGGHAAAHGTAEGKEGATKHKAHATKVEQTPFGREGNPAKVTRTIPISMSDQMRYEPSEIRVKAGETVKLVVANKGQVLHEIVLGTMADLKEHSELMKKFPGMEHDQPNMAHVKVGAKEDLVWEFNKPGEFYFACLIPGHFEAGMVGKVIVASK